MRFFDLARFFKSADLPVQKPPKVPSGKGGKVIPTYLGKTKGSKIASTSNNITNLVLSSDARNEGTMPQVIKKLVLASPDLSAALETKIKTAISSRYAAIAYDEVGRVDEEGTKLIQSFLIRLNNSTYDYTKFTRPTDIRSVAASYFYDSFRYGSACVELVLGDMRLPAYVNPVAARLIEWADNTPGSFPIYKGPDEDVPLNFPTIFYSSSVQDGETPYAESPLQAAIQVALWDADFMDDLRRAASKNLMQRLKITIDSEKYRATLPLETQTDQEKLRAHMAATISTLEDQMAGLSPEDTLVIFDTLGAETIQDSNRSEDRSILVLQNLINGKMAAGAKILPSVIGRSESSSAASTESLLFLKTMNAAQNEFNLTFSKVLTLALRLFGSEAYATFAFEEVNLRPELELASFRAIEQSTELELLSLGLTSDIESSLKLTGSLPPEGFTPLSGTGFATAKADTSGNDYSNTSVDTSSGKTDSTQSTKDSQADEKGVKSA